MTENAASFVGEIPAEYDRGLGPVLFVEYAREMARRVAESAPARVLETAAGTGIVTAALHAALPDAAITATDLNDDMLVVARAKLRSASSVSFATADALDLPYGEDAFDVMACSFGVMFYPDKPRSFREAHRVLRAGGRYEFCVWDGHDTNPWAGITNALVHEQFPDDPPPFYSVPFGFGAPFIDSFTAMLTDAGFVDIEVDVVDTQPAVASWEDFARGVVFGNPILNQIESRGGITAEQIHEMLIAGFELRFGSSPTSMPLRAIFYRSTKVVP